MLPAGCGALRRERVEGDGGRGRGVQRVDAFAHGDPHAEVGRAEPSLAQALALVPDRERGPRDRGRVDLAQVLRVRVAA